MLLGFKIFVTDMRLIRSGTSRIIICLT